MELYLSRGNGEKRRLQKLLRFWWVVAKRARAQVFV
jgi:hypothetical protein